jgi:formylglycine-generating enzyme required for sulfatase activity
MSEKRRKVSVRSLLLLLLGVATTVSAQTRVPIPGTAVDLQLVRITAGTTTLNGQTIAVKPFEVTRSEITWDQYDAYALSTASPAELSANADAAARPSKPYGAPDYGWGHSGFAAISIAWQAAEAYCAWLSAITGERYRLPTEAEWQLLADRAGISPGKRNEMAWHAGNSEERAHAVGTKSPDALGLVDLFGNAAEWVLAPDGKRVTRGGSFRDAPAMITPAARAVPTDAWNERDPQIPSSRWWLSDGPFVGFRVVREVR